MAQMTRALAEALATSAQPAPSTWVACAAWTFWIGFAVGVVAGVAVACAVLLPALWG